MLYLCQSMLLVVLADTAEGTVCRVKCLLVPVQHGVLWGQYWSQAASCHNSCCLSLALTYVSWWLSLILSCSWLEPWGFLYSYLSYWGVARSQWPSLNCVCSCHSDQDFAVIEACLMLCYTTSDLSGWYSCICALHLSWWHSCLVCLVHWDLWKNVTLRSQVYTVSCANESRQSIG